MLDIMKQYTFLKTQIRIDATMKTVSILMETI